MRNLQLLRAIRAAFPGSIGAVSDETVRAKPDLADASASMALHDIVPGYMAWCVMNADQPHELAHDYTLQALAEQGRSRNPRIAHLRFKFDCSLVQRQVVVRYLEWCRAPELLLDGEQVRRALSHWVVGAQQHGGQNGA